ncbi:TniQ family protein [Curtobacterium sp. MCPF17_003]|uniref:TniQ family protein n=1 Tax=Curtobacterium sp. MCPF17_003 TaxID=2175637 RepID=UPI0015E8B5DC
MNGTFAQSKNWTRGGGTRYCPTCLLERPGVFYTEWRLWWCFVCERHNAVLHDSCPACHQPIVEASPRETECRDPSLCWALYSESDYCRHPLAQTWREER